MPHPREDLLAEIATLRNRNEELEAENAFIRERLATPDAEYWRARALGIRPWAIPALRLFMDRQYVSKYALLAIADDKDWGKAERYPHQAVHWLRKYLSPHGIEIKSMYGGGYQITPADQARLKDLVH